MGTLHNFKDLTGQKFNRLTVIELIGTNEKHHCIWKCLCDCGNVTQVETAKLKNGDVKSCGCLLIEKISTHGMCHSRPYSIWHNMISRCTNVSNKRYEDYGGRGIKVCGKWLNFEGFWEDMGQTYKKGLTIDRIDNDKDYSKNNCKWSTPKEQSNNRRNNYLVTFNGETQTLKQWAERLNINYSTLRKRLIRGWSILRALSEGVD